MGPWHGRRFDVGVDGRMIRWGPRAGRRGEEGRVGKIGKPLPFLGKVSENRWKHKEWGGEGADGQRRGNRPSSPTGYTLTKKEPKGCTASERGEPLDVRQ